MELKNVKVVGFYLQKLFNTNLDNSKDYDSARENNLSKSRILRLSSSTATADSFVEIEENDIPINVFLSLNCGFVE